MARNFVGIDLGSYDVKLALVSVSLRGSQVLSQVRVPAPSEGEGNTLATVMEMALALLRERNWLHLPLAVVLPAGSGSYRLLEFPFADTKRIAQTLPFEIEGKFALPMEELVYDHLASVTPDKRGVAFVTGVRKSLIDQVVDRFKAAGADLRVLTLAPLALAQLSPAGARHRPGVQDPNTRPGALILDVGHRYCEVAAIGDKDIVGARSFRFGGASIDRGLRKALKVSSSPEELAQLKSDVDRIDLRDPPTTPAATAVVAALDQLVKELGRTRQYLQAECGYDITEVRLTGAGSQIHGFESWLSAQLGLPVHRLRADDFRNKLTGEIEEWVATGAALAASRRPVMQLYNPHGSRASDVSWIAERLPTLSYLGAMVLAALAIDTVVQVRAEERQRDAYAAELQAVSNQVFGSPLSSADEVRELLAAANESNQQSGIPARGAADVLAMLVKVATPDGADSLTKGGHDSNGAATGDSSTAATSDVTSTTTGSEGAGLPAVPADAGIVADDGLYFRSVDIRERKLSLNVAALRASARDRLKRKFESIPCIKLVTAGKTSDRNEFKEFSFEIDHNCYHEAGVAIEP